MTNYTVTLTDTEQTAMEYISVDVYDWITNAAKNRARIAIEEIIRLNTAYCNDNSIAIAVGRDAQVAQALELGVIDKAADRAESEKP
tara:strand:- start:353 stop:613 length:261 start_codon:yes stop_codon:yes gene_type:complete